MNFQQSTPPKLAYPPREAARLMGVSRATFYRELAAGRIAARKSGKRTLVLVEDIERWLESLPTISAA